MWFKRIPGFGRRRVSSNIPEGIWIKCDGCKEIVYRKEIESNLNVCPRCNYHFKISAKRRLELLYDEGVFDEFDANLVSTDPLEFKDLKKYKDRLSENYRKTGLNDALIAAEGNIGNYRVIACALEFAFMGGSMGAVVGEKLARAVERACHKRLPFVTVSASGGARMQESVVSLMQMAKTSASITMLSEFKLPFISILTNPTTGGVSASFAMLGDVIISEPQALIGFAGPRVIKETIGQRLPEGFQTAEFLLEHGFIDMVVDRKRLKKTIIKLLELLVD